MLMKDKVVIVTGGSGLLGSAMILDIRKKGGIAINADMNVKTNLNKFEINVDITNDSSIENCINQILSHFKKIDGLVNNAYPRTSDWGKKFEEVEAISWRKNIDMQLNSTFVFCQKVLKVMASQKYGAIVNIGSTYGVVGNDFTIYEEYGGTSPAAYSAIKGGVINFTRYLASYFGPIGIRVNCVSPGGIFDSQHLSFVKRYENKVPLRRMGNPDDIAPSVTFLLSEEAKYITGHNLLVDGGWTCI
jgi:NAD(P)-dependent dehydrogenase (short-subunit alcohol dehydrogenase family)